MKKIILLLFTVLFAKLCFSQDTIVKTNGEQIRAKIIEISPSEIKYKKLNFEDGPTYIEKKSEIDFIKYANGIKEKFERQSPNNYQKNVDNTIDYYGGPAPLVTNTNNKIDMWGSRYRYQGFNINEREVHTLLLKTNNKQIINLVQQSKEAHALQFIGFLGIPLGIATAYLAELSLLNSYNSNYNTSANRNTYEVLTLFCGIVAIACPVSSGIFKHNRMNYNREAIRLYNEKY